MNQNKIMEIFMDSDCKFQSTPLSKPSIAHVGDAGIDFYCPKNYIIPPQGQVLIPLNVKVKIKNGYFLYLTGKSGISCKKGLICTPGVIDSGYEGIISAHFFNPTDSDIELYRNEKIIQGIVMQTFSQECLNFIDAYDNESERGERGFGSSQTEI